MRRADQSQRHASLLARWPWSVSLLCAAVALLASCSSTGSDEVTPTSETSAVRDLNGFDRISVGDSVEVGITVGSTYSVRIDAGSMEAAAIFTEVVDSELHVSVANGVSTGSATLRAFIELPDLVGLEVEDAGGVTISGVFAESFDLAVRDSAEVEASGNFGSLNIRIVDSAELYLSGVVAEVYGEIGDSSTVRIIGEPAIVDVAIADASDADFSALVTGRAIVELSGSVEVDFRGASSISGRVSDDAELVIASDAESAVMTSDAAVVSRSD